MTTAQNLKSLAVLAVLAAAFAAQAQPYPTKAVKIIAPFAPGGGSDFIARAVAQKLSQRLGQPVIVDNRPGAGGNIGTEQGIKSAPDGYTLTLVAASYSVNPALYKLTFDPVNDMVPVIQLSQGPYIVAVHPSVPVNTLKELIEYAKKNPEKLSYASSGLGGHVHLATAVMADMAGSKMAHIPYKGSGPALSDTIAGNTQVILGSVATTLQYVKSGRLRALAVTTATRNSALPDVPTVAEAGVPGYQVLAWHGLIAPKGTPKAIVEQLNKEANAVLTSKEVIDMLSTDGLTPAGGPPENLVKLIVGDISRWKDIVAKSGIKAE
jgi:tripartite-type tricarboxylate transporter receptor subunit TctC